MKVGFVQLLGVWPPHTAVDLELAEEHARNGDAVHLFACRGNLLSCDTNIDHDRRECRRCMARRARAWSVATARPDTTPFPVLTRAEKRKLLALPYSFANSAELRNYKFETFDAGEAALSSIVSRYRNPFPDMAFDRNLVRRTLVSCVGVYLALRREIRTRGIDRMYVFNGRFANLRAALRACQAEGVDCHVHDRGFDRHHYSVFKNRMLSEIDPYRDDILRAWHAAPADVRETTAARFYELRRRGVIPNWRSFIDGQRADTLPPGWNPDRRNVAVYITAEDEFVANGEDWINGIYPQGQAAAIARIGKDLQAREPSMHLWVRIHPGLKGVENAFIRDMLRLHGGNISVIPADSEVDSYRLLEACEKALTFGSTIGIEAVYWGKPSVLAGPCYYRDLGGCVVPKTHEGVVEAVRATLPAPERLAALQFGYHEASVGEPYKVYQATTPFEGVYRGLDLGGPLSSEGFACEGVAPGLQRYWMLKAKLGLTGRLKW